MPVPTAAYACLLISAALLLCACGGGGGGGGSTSSTPSGPVASGTYLPVFVLVGGNALPSLLATSGSQRYLDNGSSRLNAGEIFVLPVSPLDPSSTYVLFISATDTDSAGPFTWTATSRFSTGTGAAYSPPIGNDFRDETNALRSDTGLNTLASNTALTNAATKHAGYQAIDSGGLNHQEPNQGNALYTSSDLATRINYALLGSRRSWMNYSWGQISLVSSSTNPVEHSTLTLGKLGSLPSPNGSVTFEFTNSAPSAGNVQVARGISTSTTLANLVTAVNANQTSFTAYKVYNGVCFSANTAGRAYDGALSATTSAFYVQNTGLFTGAWLDYASGEIQLLSNPPAGTTITLGSKTFEFTNVAPALGNIAITIGTTAHDTLVNLINPTNGMNASGSAFSAYVVGDTVVLAANSNGSAYNGILSTNDGSGTIVSLQNTARGGSSSIDVYAEIIASTTGPVSARFLWNTVYHRLPMMRSETLLLGFGDRASAAVAFPAFGVPGPSSNGYTTGNMAGNSGNPIAATFWPANLETGVELDFSTDTESPDPLSAGNGNGTPSRDVCGPPLHAAFPTTFSYGSLTVTLQKQ